MRVRVVCTLSPGGKKGNPKAAPLLSSPASVSLRRPRVLNQRGGQQADAHAAAEAIGLALCPVPEHEGYCPVPWTTMVVRFEDLEPEDQAPWQEVLDEQRIVAREAGEPGA